MTLTTSCEKHVSKEVLSFFEKLFNSKAKYGMVTKKEYKTRCQKNKIRNFIKYDTRQLYFGTLV